MAKKTKPNHVAGPSNAGGGLDMSKGFGNGAFDGLKALRDRQQARAADSARRLEEERRAEAERERRRAREISEMRFTEDDLRDAVSGDGADESEIFEMSMRDFRMPADIYTSKFNSLEPEKSAKQVRPPADEHPSMTEEEREFAIFTQEMAMTKVQRLTNVPRRPQHKPRNKGWRAAASAVTDGVAESAASVVVPPSEEPATRESVAEVADGTVDVKPVDHVKMTPAPERQERGMRTGYVSPTVAVTSVGKGVRFVESEDETDLSASQRHLVKDAKHYESKYGPLITLHLRGLSLEAAKVRLREFTDACVREGRQYAVVVCGKGNNSPDRPVIKEHTIQALRKDQRVVEYAPVMNVDGNFGAIYVHFKRNPHKV